MLFGLFKKRKKETITQSEVIALTEDQIHEIRNDIKILQSKLPNQIDESHASIYEEIGLKYSEIGDSESAISFLEKSLELKLSMGDGYKKLLSLYNQKRAEAARNKDNNGIDYYMSKMDELRNIAKKLTILRS